MNIILNIADGRIDHEIRKLAEETTAAAAGIQPDWKVSVSGIRIGSETCSRMLDFLSADDFRRQISRIREQGFDAYAVFPDVAQSQWKKAQTLLDACGEEGVRGIAVNDFGMLAEASERSFERVILGRLFDRRMRDPRTGISWKEDRALETLSILTEEYAKLYRREHLYAAEMECFGTCAGVPEEVKLMVHVPYLLLTCGRFCEIGGIGLSEPQRYRINTCRRQCRNVAAVGSAPFLTGKWYQRGNALYTTAQKSTFLKIAAEHENLEMIYTPGLGDARRPASVAGDSRQDVQRSEDKR